MFDIKKSTCTLVNSDIINSSKLDIHIITNVLNPNFDTTLKHKNNVSRRRTYKCVITMLIVITCVNKMAYLRLGSLKLSQINIKIYYRLVEMNTEVFCKAL